MAKKETKAAPKLVVPTWRPHDHVSKRGVKYWWAPEWVRDLNGKPSKIRPIKDKKTGEVDLHMESKDGKTSYIQGSIQREFKKWHTDRSIDYLLLGEDADDLLNVDRNEATAEARTEAADQEEWSSANLIEQLFGED